MEHQIVEDKRYQKKPQGTGAWGDSDVLSSYRCTRCQTRGQTPEEINQQPCQQPEKGYVNYRPDGDSRERYSGGRDDED